GDGGCQRLRFLANKAADGSTKFVSMPAAAVPLTDSAGFVLPGVVGAKFSAKQDPRIEIGAGEIRTGASSSRD
ncbi:MAG: hypothetical protein ACKO2L_12055, partial [Planctomycetaceae bacterium]